MTLPDAGGHLGGDPRAPRERDLARPVPRDGSDLAELDDAKILAAPDEPREWEEWRRQLRRWRDEARARIAYSGERYERADLAWTQRCFSVCLAWLWDEQLYDPARHAFTVDAFLDADAGFGGYDAVVLWHTYPLIGIDERDQFDFYRQAPGLPAAVRAFRARGVRVFMEYHAWDRGARLVREDASELAALVRDTAIDGVFLDSMREAPAGVRATLDRIGRSVVLEGESNIPLARVADHEMSWAQWQADSATPGVLRAKWFEQRHMLHQTRRWDRDRTAQLRTAWLNGAGMLVWENVFGSWVGWSPRDRTTLAAMLGVQRRFAAHFTHGEWTPLADPDDLDRPSLWSSRFALGASRLWTIAGRDDRALGPADAIRADAGVDERWFELLSGSELIPDIRGGRARVGLPPMSGPFAAVLAVPSTKVEASLRDLLAAQRARPRDDDARSPVRPARRVAVPRLSASAVPGGMLARSGGELSLTIRYRLRETGMYEGAPFADLWKPLPPLLHHIEEERLTVDLGAFAVSRTEITNAEYARFVDATAYRPAVADRFLAHWRDGAAPAGTEREPVRYVDLDDARAYARWAELRLPTELEWQVAAADPAFGRGEPLVWNWTESEHTDGRTRFVILKGGSHARREGSEWYTDGGPQPPEVSLKFLRAGPSIERSSAIGFRCAIGLDRIVR
jgi:formylglycine-generating enzyme required for sulfatase activity